MKNRWAVSALALVAFVGCGDDTATQNDMDMGPMADAAVTADATTAEDAAITADAAVTADAATAEDAAVTADAATESDATVAEATWGDVHTEFRAACAGCHGGASSGGHNMAQSNAAAAYADSQLSASACSGLTKGACAAVRVRAGTMPPGGLSPSERTRVADIIDSWVEGGQLAP